MDTDLICPICLNHAENAVETECCFQIFCERCLLEIPGHKSCPTCRVEPFRYRPSPLARRIIGNMPVECPNEGCQYKTTRSELPSHSSHCEFRKLECPLCSFSDHKKKLLEHFCHEHPEEMIHFLESFQDQTPKEKNENNNTFHGANDPISPRKNSSFKLARLGSTGKFYCGKKFVSSCDCCDGVCGPTNGCNCVHCMQLDIEARNLEIGSGYLINREGFIARKGKSGKFYCGRWKPGKFLQYDSQNYCGPSEGANCKSCSKLDVLSQTRYKSLVTPPTAIALSNYKGKSNMDLSIKKNERISIISKSSPSRWFGQNQNGKRGYFPSSFVSLLN